jgi:uncharacterized protein (TIGR02453 family)
MVNSNKNKPMSKLYLDFLNALAESNQKAWMDANKDFYAEVKGKFLEDVEILLRQISLWEPALSSFRAKDCIFRQNRDVRFSKNKNPYKTNLAAYFAVGGKKSDGPGYYLHVQPGQSFVAGGIWMPQTQVLKKIRQEIDYSGQELMEIFARPEFRNLFSELEGDQLKTRPKDYEADHPHMNLLKYKSFIVSSKISDESIRSGSFIQEAVTAFKVMKPFHDFLNRAVVDAEGGEGFL